MKRRESGNKTIKTGQPFRSLSMFIVLCLIMYISFDSWKLFSKIKRIWLKMGVCCLEVKYYS